MLFRIDVKIAGTACIKAANEYEARLVFEEGDAMTMRCETQMALQTALDCFTGADGGVSFVHFRRLVEELDQLAAGGDEPAAKIIELVKRYARLIDFAQRR